MSVEPVGTVLNTIGAVAMLRVSSGGGQYAAVCGERQTVVQVRGARLTWKQSVTSARWLHQPTEGVLYLWIGTEVGKLRILDAARMRVVHTERLFAEGIAVAEIFAVPTPEHTSVDPLVAAVGSDGSVRILKHYRASTGSSSAPETLCLLSWPTPQLPGGSSLAARQSLQAELPAPLLTVVRRPRRSTVPSARTSDDPHFLEEDVLEWMLLAAPSRGTFLTSALDVQSSVTGRGNRRVRESSAAALASSVVSIARSWWGSSGSSPSPSDSTSQDSSSSDSSTFGGVLIPGPSLNDSRRVAHTVLVEPQGARALVLDSLGRLSVMDVAGFHLVRMLKGYRHCRVAWLHAAAVGRARPSLGFVVHMPRRSLLEFWNLSEPARVATLAVPRDAVLLSEFEPGPSGGSYLCFAYLWIPSTFSILAIRFP